MEQQIDQRLIDQARENPIKNPFRIGWEFFILNKSLAFMLMGIYLLLLFLSLIPAVGVIFSILGNVFLLAIQIYAGKLFYEAGGMQDFAMRVKETRVGDIVEENTKTATGAYLGWLLLMFLVGIIVVVSLGSGNGIVTRGVEDIPLLPILIFLVVFVLSYVFPIVQANIIFASNFKEGFFAVMGMFSANYWSKAMTGAYFKYISLLSLVLVGVGFVASIVFGMIFNISPVVAMFSIVFVIPLMVVFVVVIGISSLIANDIADEAMLN